MAADLSPSTMRLALLSPIHGQSIDHIARQLENYRVFLAPFELRHYFHVSLESYPELQSDLTAFAEREGHSIVFTQHRRATWRYCTADALSELIKSALTDPSEHDAVLIHTDADLLFSSKIKTSILTGMVHCGEKKFKTRTKWKWIKHSLSDPRIKTFTDRHFEGNYNNLSRGRVCGSLIPWNIFEKFSNIYLSAFDNNYFESTTKTQWPLTEVTIPTILRMITGDDQHFLPPLITAPKKKLITVRDIKRAFKQGDSFGLKKIARDTDSDAFHYLMRLQAQAAEEA